MRLRLLLLSGFLWPLAGLVGPPVSRLGGRDGQGPALRLCLFSPFTDSLMPDFSSSSFFPDLGNELDYNSPTFTCDDQISAHKKRKKNMGARKRLIQYVVKNTEEKRHWVGLLC